MLGFRTISQKPSAVDHHDPEKSVLPDAFI